MPWYFAYGSNLYKKRLRDRIGNWQNSRKGILENYELTFDSRGYADVIEKLDARVYGALCLFTDEQMETLDRYEGVPKGIYRRETVNVKVNGELVKAITYVKVRKTAFSTPPAEYLELIISGLEEHDFDENIIEEIKKIARTRS